MQREQIVLGTHGQYTPAIGAALYYVRNLSIHRAAGTAQASQLSHVCAFPAQI